MPKILRKAVFSKTEEVNRQYTSDLIFYDEKNSCLISYSRIHSRWKFYENVSIIEYSEEIKNTALSKALAKELKLKAKEFKLDNELDALRREMYYADNEVQTLLPTVLPSGESIRHAIENSLPQDVRVSSWTVSPEGPHSLNLAKENDLGKHRDDIAEYGYDDDHHLKGSEEAMYKKYCPAMKTQKAISKGLKLTTVEPKYQSHSIGDKLSVTFSTTYAVSIPNLTGKNFKKVCDEIIAIAQRL